jgi:hypothetical protein
MSDIFFTDSAEVPVPPDEVRIRELTAVPRVDGARVDVDIVLTPFQKRPNIELAITNAAGHEVAALSVVEAIESEMEFTVHIRETQPRGSYKVTVLVFYADIEAAAPTNGGEQPSAGDTLSQAKHIVDERFLSFKI